MFLRSRSVRVAGAALAASVLLLTAACSDDDEPAGSGMGGDQVTLSATPTGSATESGGTDGKKGEDGKKGGKKGASPSATSTKPYVPGLQDGSCPEDFPVKFVNQTGVGKIYATPGGDAYDKIRPGFCFRSVEDAQKQPGYQEFKGDWPLD